MYITTLNRFDLNLGVLIYEILVLSFSYPEDDTNDIMEDNGSESEGKFALLLFHSIKQIILCIWVFFPA